MIYRIRVTANTSSGYVYRDIEIASDALLEDLHNVIIQSFGLEGTEPASFYLLDEEMNTTDEIPLFPMDEQMQTVSMDKVSLQEVLNRQSPRMAYVYDYLNMWQFLVELMEEGPEIPGRPYPFVAHAQGQLPDNPPDVQFDIQNIDDLFKDEDWPGENEDPFDDYEDLDDQWY